MEVPNECKYISFPDVPVIVRFWIVEVAPGLNSTRALSTATVNVPVVEAALAIVVVAPEALFLIVQLLNPFERAALEVAKPEIIWLLVPFMMTVPELWVKVPLLA